MKRKIYQQRNAEIASVHGGLYPIAIQSNHLLGNPQDTLTERLLANLTGHWLICLACKDGFGIQAKFNDFAAWPFSPVPGRV